MGILDKLFGKIKSNNVESRPKVMQEDTKTPQMKIYYLGVDSKEKALNTIDRLSFFTVVDKINAQVKYLHEGRIEVSIYPVKDPIGAIVYITGKFTHEEMNEIEALSQYEHIPLRDVVIDFVAQMMIKTQKMGVSVTHQILGKDK